MKITIQAIKDRESNVVKIINQIKAEVYYDYGMNGCFNSFVQMLNIPFDDYKLHLQDDIIIPEQFEKYLEVIKNDMKEKDIDVLSLFAPRRAFLKSQYEKGIKYSEFPNFLWLQGTVFSRRAVDEMKEYLKINTQIKWDDVFVAAYLKHYKRKAYVHLPSIIQHNININSSMGNANSIKRTSDIYDKNYIKNYYA